MPDVPRDTAQDIELAVQALVEWVLGEQALELGDKLGVAAFGKVHVEPIFACGQPRLLELERRALRKRFVAQIGERLAAPKLERLAQQRGITVRAAALGQDLEPLEIQLARFNWPKVSRRACEEPVVAERLPQLRDGVLENLGRSRWRPFAPELVDEPIACD